MADKTNIQNHSGSGDNVLGNKIVNQSVSLNALLKPIQGILEDIRHRRQNEARSHIDRLLNTSDLDAEASDTLNIIRLMVEIKDSNPPSDAYHLLASYLSFSHDKSFVDIAISIQIQLDAFHNKLNDARSRFEGHSDRGPYSKESFFEYVAQENEIQTTFEIEKLSLSDIELCGLVRGAIRMRSPVIALSIAEHLYSVRPIFNSKVLLHLAKTLSFEASNDGTHYWRISAESKREVVGLCSASADLLAECKATDLRIVDVSVSLLNFVLGDHEELIAACWQNVSGIEELLPKAGARIRQIYDRRAEGLTGVLRKLALAEQDPLYRRNIISNITSSSKITLDESTVLVSLGDKISIKSWVDAGGRILEGSELEKDFVLLELRAMTCDGHPKIVDQLRNYAKEFLNKHSKSMNNLTLQRLLGLAEKLVSSGVPDAAIGFLEFYIPENNLWASPLVRCYLNALLTGHQMKKLDRVLASLDPDDWDGYIWQFKARQLDYLDDEAASIEAIWTALEKSPLSADAWHFLISLLRRSNHSDSQIAEALSGIPEELFKEPSSTKYAILFEIAMLGDFIRAENHLMKWFVENPEKNSLPLTNFHLSEIFRGGSFTTPSSTVSKCLAGVRFEFDGKVATKLIVADEVKQHSYFLQASSPLGHALHEMNVGETRRHGFSEIKLTERFPPFVAAFQIALSLRHALNDGRDCFFLLELPTKPDEMIENLERKLRVADQERDEFNSNKNIPLLMKGFQDFPHNPIQAALRHLTDKQSFKHHLPTFGIEQPKQVILDTYSASYLALTGLAFPLVDIDVEVILTDETKYWIRYWLNDVNREDYLTIAARPEGGLIRTNTEDMRQLTKDVQKGFRCLIEYSQNDSPGLFDLPPDLLRIEAFVDSSVMSSLVLSTAKSIPWLCIDPMFSHLAKSTGASVINTTNFIIYLSQSAPLGVKTACIGHHVQNGMPFPITHNDLILLSKSRQEFDCFLLSKLLRIYPGGFFDTETAIAFLHQILVAVLANAYIEGDIAHGLRPFNAANNGHAEHIFFASCYISMHYDDGGDAESKLATLLSSLFFRFRGLDGMTKIISDMATTFVNGHFLSVEGVNRDIDKLLRRLLSSEHSKSCQPPA